MKRAFLKKWWMNPFLLTAVFSILFIIITSGLFFCTSMDIPPSGPAFLQNGVIVLSDFDHSTIGQQFLSEAFYSILVFGAMTASLFCIYLYLNQKPEGRFARITCAVIGISSLLWFYLSFRMYRYKVGEYKPGFLPSFRKQPLRNSSAV